MFRKLRGKQETRLGMDVLTDIIGNKRRRLAIKSLDVDERISLSDLAEEVARREIGEDPIASQRKNVYVALHQAHLPKMDDSDIFHYYEEEKVIATGPEFEPVQYILKEFEEMVK